MEASGQATAITVSQLNRRVKALLEQGLTRLWIEGELSNIARPASGHLYFTLKDDSAQIRAAFFRGRQRGGSTTGFKNGDKVLAFGQVSLYEARGDYQLIVEQVEPAGEGALKQQFERLKKKLHAEGLFDEDHKRPLPKLPTRIGVITSPSGAAVRDVLNVLGRRFPLVPVVIYPAAVQGASAPAELVAALDAAERRAECDVLILCRGGGSLEDLMAFNDEGLARRIAAAHIPVVSAVGHEIDVTIADFVADVRAPTPSGAAELVVPDQQAWRRAVAAAETRLLRLGRRAVEAQAQTLDWLSRRLYAGSPARRVERQQDRLRIATGRLVAGMRAELSGQRRLLLTQRSQLLAASPAIAVQRLLTRLAAARQNLAAVGRNWLGNRGHRLALAARALHSVSPLATLERGYAIVTDAKSGKILSDARQADTGDTIEARLASGRLRASVNEVLTDET